MKNSPADFAINGAEPCFDQALHVAQVNLPDWLSIESVFSDIFKRKYYANHGPLVNKLDGLVSEITGARNAVCVSNGTFALMLLCRAISVSGEVIVPAFTFPATVQALIWAGLKPVLCDVDRDTHMLSIENMDKCLTPKTVAVLGVHIWGRACNPVELGEYSSDRNLVLIFDACHAFGCSFNGQNIGTFGAGEAFSFHATKIVNAGEGGCITTNDDKLAEKLRHMRSFHDSGINSHIEYRMNAKMSEAQAGLAIASIDELEKNINNNRKRYFAYKRRLDNIPGLHLIDMEINGVKNNYQYIAVDVEKNDYGLSRDKIYKILESENVICRKYFYPGMHKLMPWLLDAGGYINFYNTELLCNRLLQLPNSQNMNIETVEMVCELLDSMHKNSSKLNLSV